MIDPRIDRPYLLLVLLILIVPLVGVLTSAITLTEARSGLPASLIGPLQTPVALPPGLTPAAPTQPGEATGHFAAGADLPAPIQRFEPVPDSRDAPDRPIEATAPPDATSAGTSTVTPSASPTREPEPPPASVFENSQVVALYGSPISQDLGVLGLFPPDELAHRLLEESRIYDNLNGDRRVTPALDLIYAQAQADPTENGLYLRYLDDWSVETYLSLAERYDLQLILDLHIGRGNMLDEVRKVERFLVNPRVHIAIDPEYAVGPEGVPLWTPGVITGNEINDVQDYLAWLVAQYHLPPKLLVIHQYMDETVVNGNATRQVPNVDVVLNMDGIGPPSEKAEKYEKFASRSYAVHRSYNVFIQHDDPALSEKEIMRLSPQPDMVIYQ